MGMTLTRQQAVSLADELLVQHPRFRDSEFAKMVSLISRFSQLRPFDVDNVPSPYALPSSSRWGLLHPDYRY